MTSSFAFLGHSILCANLLPGFTFQILFMCQRALKGMLLTHNISALMSEFFFVRFLQLKDKKPGQNFFVNYC